MRFTAIDIETTGLGPEKEKIIEIGAVKYEDGVQKEVFSTLLHPQTAGIPVRITELTGITPQMLEHAPDFMDICQDVLDFIGDDVLMAHHISFDYAFLKRAVLNGMSTKWSKDNGFEKKGIDTLKIARTFLPELESRSLGALCKHYQIPIDAHRAEEDARATAFL